MFIPVTSPLPSMKDVKVSWSNITESNDILLNRSVGDSVPRPDETRLEGGFVEKERKGTFEHDMIHV